VMTLTMASARHLGGILPAFENLGNRSRSHRRPLPRLHAPRKRCRPCAWVGGRILALD
jgi:hypothetical protein